MQDNTIFLPEGMIENSNEYLGSMQALSKALSQDKIIEAPVVMCDLEHNLYVDLGNGLRGKIPRQECALGITEGTTREIAIISRVGKPTCFKVVSLDGEIILSRKKAQKQALDFLLNQKSSGDVLNARVTHLEQFGAFVDIGCGVISLIGIENLSISRIFHPKERFYEGMPILAVITGIDYNSNRILLSHKELLGTWEQNSKNFSAGQTVMGIVRSVESYGIFIELTPNLSGLAENRADIHAGQHVSVYVKSIIPEKMKIKLSIIDVLPNNTNPCEFEYYIENDHIETFKYTPDSCTTKQIISNFS